MTVLVYTENWDGKFKKLSFELVSFAHSVAKQTGKEVIALSIGKVADDELQKLAAYGVSKVVTFHHDKLDHLVNHVYTAILAEAAKTFQANLVVLANNNTGKALAPGLAVKLNAGVVTGVNGLPVTMDPFVVKKKVFTGKAYTEISIQSEVKVITLAQNSYEVIESPGSTQIETLNFQLDESLITTRVKEVQKQTGKVLLTDAEIVVSGGRGMKGPEFWGPLEELAEVLGAATACSRPVSDEGWRPHTEHVGQTGKIIAPNLYFALGISGAIQHLGGVSSSKFIVAINKDKDAPIFEAANYGIVGDVNKVLPELIQAIKAAKAE